MFIQSLNILGRPVGVSVGQVGGLNGPFSQFCGTRRILGQRIIGGKRAELGHIPWQISIFKLPSDTGGREILTCGGALITERSVLTASHCLKLPPERYKVVAGRTSSHTESDDCHGQTFNVKNYVKHPHFNSKTLKNDIALIFIESEFGQGARWTSYVMPVCLPPTSTDVTYESGTQAMVSGWGMLDEKATFMSSYLQHVNVPIISESKCIELYSKLTSISSSQICAGVPEGGKDACTGDSGGPLVTLEGERFYVIGVVSFGMGCGRSEYPGVYTKVMYYLPWIFEILEQVEGVVYPSSSNTTNMKSTTKLITMSTTKLTTSTTRLATQSSSTTTTRRTTLSPSTTTTRTTTQSTTTTIKVTSSLPSRIKKKLGPVCSGYYEYAQCPSEYTISVKSGFYGRSRQSALCGGRRFRRQCSLSSAKRNLSSFCNGKQFCKVSAGYSVSKIFREYRRCRWYKPYVQMSYDCVVNLKFVRERSQEVLNEPLKGKD